ncbi:MAG: hypothetical protein RLZZ344_456 [Pseudomonadota bacterium]|jgi:catechol 2,3-dioxygenase-like lactoylglutathione lyase family enzyme
MAIQELNHYLIRAADLKASRDFYVNVLGLSEMDRPNFPFPGYWLGTNGVVQVHMAPDNIPNREFYYLGTPPGAVSGQPGTGSIDHVAFIATDHERFLEKLRAAGVHYRPRYLKDSQLFQVFIRDPDGITIELNFFGVSESADWGGEDYDQMARVTEQKPSS